MVDADTARLPDYVASWHDTFDMSLSNRAVRASLVASDTIEAAHFFGLHAPALDPGKQRALQKALCGGYPLTAVEIANIRMKTFRTERRQTLTQAEQDEMRLLTAQAMAARDVRSRDLLRRLQTYKAAIDVETPLAVIRNLGRCITVDEMNSGPTADVPPHPNLGATLLHEELLQGRCNLVSLLLDKYARRSRGQAQLAPGTSFTPGRFGCTASWLGARFTLGIARVTDFTCDGGNGRYVCSFDMTLYCRADFGDFSSGTALGTDDLMCVPFQGSFPGTAVFVRDGSAWRVEEFVPAR